APGSELFDQRIGNLQGRQGAVVVQRNRVVDAQSQDHLGLHVDALVVETGVDEYRCQPVTGLRADGFLLLQGDGLALQVAQPQRRNHYIAGLPRLQGDLPAGEGDGFATDAGKLVHLAGRGYLEQLLERLHVGLAEEGGALCFQGQLDGLAEAELCAVDTGEQLGGIRGAAEQKQEKDSGQAHHRFVSWRLRCSRRNLRRSSSPGSSGICLSHWSVACCCSVRVGTCSGGAGRLGSSPG